MKKNFVIGALALVMVLTSCATQVSVPYTQPAEINMGSYRNIAIASTVPYKGLVTPKAYVNLTGFYDSAWLTYVPATYSSGIQNTIASYATDQLVSTLSGTGFFTKVMNPDRTDDYIAAGNIGVDITAEFKKAGIDAVIMPKVNSMVIDEYITREEYIVKEKDKDGKIVERKDYRFTLNQSATIDFGYSIIDTSTMSVVASKNFSYKLTNSERCLPSGYAATPIDNLFKQMIRKFMPNIKQQLVPTSRSVTVSLKANKPKDKGIESAYTSAKDGNLNAAMMAFKQNWEVNHHIPSGYNAALIMAGLGKIDDAIALISDVAGSTQDADVVTLHSDLLVIQQKNAESAKQFAGTQTTPPVQNSVNIFQSIIGE